MTLDDKPLTTHVEKKETVIPKEFPKEVPKKFDKPERQSKIKVVLTMNDDLVSVTKDNKTEMIRIVPAPFMRDYQTFVPIETLFQIFNKDELKVDGNKITIERSL